MPESTRIEELERRVQLDPASIAFAALAEEYRRAGRFEDAIATCQAGLQRHPAYLSARVTFGRSLLELGRYDEAREQLEHVLRAAPENLAAIRGLAEIHHRLGDAPPSTDLREAPPRAAAAVSRGDVAAPSGEDRAAPSAAAPARPAPRPPIRLVRPEPQPDPDTPSPEPAPVTASVHAASPRVTPHAAPAAAVHPDVAALPELERFLAAIVRAREALRSAGSR